MGVGVAEPAAPPRGVALSTQPARRSGRLDHLTWQVQRLVERMNVAVVHGGDKNAQAAVINQIANLRSWKSYEGVALDIAESLKRLGCKNVQLMPDDMTLGSRLREGRIDLAWLNTAGVQGYDPMAHASSMLEMFGVPYVGHDPLTSSVLDNKQAFKRQLQAAGVPSARFMTWHPARGPLSPRANQRFIGTFGDYSGPFIVKPTCGRASLHVHVVDDIGGLANAVEEVHRATENHVLIEQFLPGREFAVSICGPIVARNRQLRHLGDAFVFSAVERVLDGEERIFTSMDLRPITTGRFRLLEPGREPHVIARLEAIARQVFMELDLDALIRLDLRADADGELNVLEANPKPDLKRPAAESNSLVCAGLERSGMDYDDLILSLLADRIDLLFSQRRGMVTALSRLLD